MNLTSAWQATLLLLALVCASATQAQPAPKSRTSAGTSAAAKAPLTTRGRAQPVAKPAEAPRFSYAVSPVPAWVVPAQEPATAAVERAPMHYRVIDEQVLVEPASNWRYTHVVRVANDAAGLAQASQIEIDFDPSIQTLTLHHLDVVRDGRRIGKIDRKRIQLLQRETQLERAMYDGRVTLSVVLDDVRVGDQIDWAYSVRGANPVFDGKFVHLAWLGSHRGPTMVSQVRLLAPRERAIRSRAGSDDVQVHSRDLGPLRETVFRREAVPQLRSDDGAPYGITLRQQVQFSEFADWAEVARWGEALFAFGDTGPLVAQKVAEIRAQTPDRAAQVLAALQFTQRDVRYFGTEIGTSTHRPAAPGQVIEQRFGDCKDKVRLLAALLRRLDVAATPVLVSSVLRSDVARMLPSPLAFDHVIARVDLDGTPYWLDATRSHQTGLLPKRQSYGFGQGLPLVAATTALAALPAPYDVERVNVTDTFRVAQFTADPLLESRVTYRGDLADAFREAVAARGLRDVAAALAAPYLKTYPRLKALASARMESPEQDDAVTFVQEFAVPEFWRFPEQRALAADLVHWGVVDALAAPKSETRRDPLSFTFPGLYRHVVVVEYPEDVFVQPASQRLEGGDAHFSLTTGYEVERRRAEYFAEARLGVDQVEARDWPAYTAKLTELMPRLGITFGVPAMAPARADALTQELRAAGEAFRSGRLKLVTQNQVQAHLKALVLSAQIAAGRLPPALEAQALTARGIEYDHLGRLEEAGNDFARALSLVPEAVPTQNAAAVNAKLRGEFDRAIELSTRILDRSPRDGEALITRAQARYFKKDLPAARADLQTLLKDRSAVRRGYPLIWLSLALRSEGQDPAALESAYPGDQITSDWPRPLIDMAVGKTSTDSAILAAKAAKNPVESLCEAYFYIGEKFFAEGNLKRAAEFWRKSVDQGVVEYTEHRAAVLRLGAVGMR